MNRITKWAAVVATTAFLGPWAAPVHSQEGGTVTGTVTAAESLQPLSGAQVSVAGTTRGTLTDARGRYLITNIPAGPQTIRVSLIGYGQGEQAVSIASGATATADFSLQTTALEIAGVVVNAVTGQVERRRALGTNVASIGVADIERAPITKLADVLTARTAGVNVQSSQERLGTAPRIRIRGANSLNLSNEPLIFVDGIQFSNQRYALGAGGAASGRLNDINPTDIESVEVLKGPAATSQYGTAAANGVLLITTKSGRGASGQWSGYAEYGVIKEPTEWPANYFSYQVNQPNATLFLPNGRVNSGNTAASARQACYNINAAAGLCRQDSTAVFNTLEDARTTPFDDGLRRKFGLSLAGGTGDTSYFISGDFEDEQGVIPVNTLERISARANLDAGVTDNLRVQLNAAYIDSDLAINSNNNSAFSPLINGLVGRAFFNPDSTSTTFARNYRLFSPSQLREFTPTEGINRMTLGGRATFQPRSWLSLSANSGLDFTNRLYELTVQPGRDIGVIAPSFYGVGARDVERTNNFLWTSNASANGVFQLTDRINSSSTIGTSFRRSLYRTLFTRGAGIVEGTRDVGGAAGQFVLDEEFEEIRTIGGFVSQQFGLDDRLFVTLGLRADDDSAFGQDFDLAFYPNANVSWVLDEEAWFPQTQLLSSFRLRAGYGTSGLRPNFRDAITLFEPFAVQVGGADVPGVILDVTGNPALKPERTTEYEVGFDGGLFDDRLGLNFTYYNKTSKDALISVPLEPSFGLTASRLDNIGRIRNSGLELGVSADVLNTRQVGLRLNLATTTLSNDILSIGGDDIDDIVINRGEQRHREGFPAGSYFQDRIVITDNGNGLLTRSEVRIARDSINGKAVPTYIGPSLPTLTNALSGDLRLFDFISISTLFEHRGGNYQLDLSTEFRCRTASGFLDRGCQATADPNATLDQQAAYIAGTFLGSRAGYIHKADFVKWRELAVSFDVPPSLRRGMFGDGLRLTLSGRNLATWTDYPGLDPEAIEGGTSNFNQGEFNNQPPVRYWTARLNFTF